MIDSADSHGLRVRERFDWPLFIAASLIVVLGMVNLYSATSVYTGARAEFYVNQLYSLVAGGILAFGVASIDYRHFERLGHVLYTTGIVLLILVLVLGRDIRGAARWISIAGFQFQPSELMKLSLIVALGKVFNDDPRSDGRTLRNLIAPFALTLLPVTLILRQPDLGTAVLLLLIFGTVISLLRLQPKSVLALIAMVAAALPLGWLYGLKDYQRQRITSFLDPEADLQGAGWHAHHARVAIGNGGTFGQGYLQGTQNQFKFLPDQYSDFPFAVFAEDWGFIGSVVLIGLYAFLSLWSIRVASQAKDRFGAVIAIGVGAMIFWHAVINLGMVLGMLPVVGATLPLFSYGGSSAITILIGIGLLMNVSMRRNQFTPARDLLIR